MHFDRRAFVQLFAVVGALGLGARAARAQGGKTVQVSMENAPRAAFEPATVAIAAGDTVEWTNSGAVLHSVDFDPALAADKSHVALPAGVAPFTSGDVEQDASFKHTFSVKGTYKYVCKYHEAMGMVGTVVVS